MAKVKIPGLTRTTFLSGWPLVALIAVGLTAVALLYGGATGGRASSERRSKASMGAGSRSG